MASLAWPGLGPTFVALVGGLVVAALLGGRVLPAPRWHFAAALGPAVGLGTLSLAYFGWRLAGAAAVAFAPLAWVGLAAAGAVALVRINRAPRLPAAARPSPDVSSRVTVVLLLAIVVFTLAAGVAFTRQLPLGRFDAWAIWTARARLLHRAAEPAVAFSLLRRAHPDDPLLLPGSLAAQFAMFDSESPRIPQATGALFLLAAAAATALAVRSVGAHPGWAATAAALWLATPMAQWWGFAQCADIPLAYLIVVAATLLALQLPSRRPTSVPPAVAGFTLGLLPWAKNEGMVLAALLGGLFAIRTLPSAEGRRRLLAVATGALPGVLAVALLRLAWGPNTDLGHFVGGVFERLIDPTRWPIVLTAFGERLAPWRGWTEWGMVWAIAAFGLLLGWRASSRRGPELAFLRWSLAAIWAAWLAVFVGTPQDLAWQSRTALDRLLLQLLPLTLAAAFGGLVGASRQTERGAQAAGSG